MSTLRRIALRRWPLVLASLLMTVSGLYAVTTIVRPVYQTTASVVLVPPKSLEEPDSNRYLALGSLDQAVGVLVRILTSDEVRGEVSADAPSGDYEVVADWNTSAPIIVVTSTAETAADSDAVLTAALAQIPTQLDGLQASIGVTDGQMISSLPLARDDAPSRLLKPLVRALLAAGVLLLALSLGLIAVVDGLLLRRARRTVAEATASAGPEPDAEPDAEPEAEAEVEPLPESQPEPLPESQPEPLPESEPKHKPVAKPKPVSPLRKPEPAAVGAGWTEEGVDDAEDRTRAAG